MSDAGSIERECTVFTRHVLGVDPDAYVLSRYHLAVTTVGTLAPRSPWDRTLLSIARWSVVAARCADAYAALFDRSSTLRKRLVMLLAILESRGPFASLIDRAPRGPLVLTLAMLVLRGLVSLLALAVGSLVLVPLRLARTRRSDARI